MKIPLDQIKPSPFQVRGRLNGELLGDLKASMKEIGLIVPIKVRPKNEAYELVYGHRRFEAAKLLKWKEIEATVEELNDEQAVKQGLSENISRNDLEIIDEARAYQLMLDEFGWSKIRISRELGVPERRVFKLLAILAEPEEIQRLIASGDEVRKGGMPEGKISPQHLSVVAGIEDPLLKVGTLKKAAKEGLTVEKTRRVTQSIKAANTDKLKQGLIDAPYDEFVHDPERVKQVVKKRGGIDPFTKREPPKQKIWDEAVARFLRFIKQMRWWVEDFDNAVDAGQLSPEAKPFVATRLKTLRNDINRVLEKLEE